MVNNTTILVSLNNIIGFVSGYNKEFSTSGGNIISKNYGVIAVDFLPYSFFTTNPSVLININSLKGLYHFIAKNLELQQTHDLYFLSKCNRRHSDNS